MEKISINDLHEVALALDNDGYRITSNKNGVVSFAKGKEQKELELSDYIKSNEKVVKPNYDNCILNVIASIKKFYGKKPEYKCSVEMDQLLKEKAYKHIAIMVIDGMGSKIIESNLDKEAFISKNKLKDIIALCPATTACAIPAIVSGKEPVETGWLGWESYFKEIDRNVVMFNNEDFFTGEKLDFDVSSILPYKKFYRNFNTNIFEIGPNFMEIGCNSFEEVCQKYLEKVSAVDKSFSYIYWNEPDSIMHKKGATSDEAKSTLEGINLCLAEMSEKLPEDTLLIVTADHGHIDCNPIYFYNFESIASLLQRSPSNEGRATFFKVKAFSKETFARRFKRYFGDYFKLIRRSDFNSKGYIGKNIFKTKNGARIRSFQGDFIALATKNYYFNYDQRCLTQNDDSMVFKSAHAGITEKEMLVPLIVVEK